MAYLKDKLTIIKEWVETPTGSTKGMDLAHTFIIYTIVIELVIKLVS